MNPALDELGGLQVALQKAAEVAELDEWTSVRLRRPVDPRAALIAELLGDQTRATNASLSLASKLQNVMRMLDRFDDPLDTYALCMECWPTNRWLTP